MKKQKMLITLAGLVAVVATSATITAYSLAGDDSSAPTGESAGTYEPAFQDDKIPTDFGSSQDPPLHGDPTYETWLKDNPPTDDMTDTPPTFNPGPGQVSDDGSVFVDNPDTGGGAIGIPDPSGTWPKDNPPTDDMTDTPSLHGDPPPPGQHLADPVDGTDVPGTEPVIEPLEPGKVVAEPTPKDHNDDTDLVRVDPGTGLLIDPLLAAGAEVKVTGEVVSEGIFSVDGSVLEVNGERVLVMDYGDAATLEAEAAGVSPTGSSVATHGRASMVLWAAPPHYFRSETAIVLYLGDSPKVIEALTSVLGPQFAGR